MTHPWKLTALVLALAIVPTVARAQAMQSVCKDGTKSAAAGKGTCSGHGGVDDTATKTFMASAKTVMCTDGAMSAGGRGACSGHGGIGTAGDKHQGGHKGQGGEFGHGLRSRECVRRRAGVRGSACHA